MADNTGHLILFAFCIGQRVWIEDAEVWGRVMELSVSRNGREYLVAYYDEDKRRQKEWIGEVELKQEKV